MSGVTEFIASNMMEYDILNNPPNINLLYWIKYENIFWSELLIWQYKEEKFLRPKMKRKAENEKI